MDIERGTYQYKEEGNADVRSTKDLKDCFAKTNQHGRMEEKASAETEVPYVFETDDICLTTGYIGGTEGNLLNIVQQFEEYEDEGESWTCGMPML